MSERPWELPPPPVRTARVDALVGYIESIVSISAKVEAVRGCATTEEVLAVLAERGWTHTAHRARLWLERQG